jgi:hypothetical protein
MGFCLCVKRRRIKFFLDALLAGVAICADKFSLAERAIPITNIHDEISVRDLAFVIDRLAGGTKTIWF